MKLDEIGNVFLYNIRLKIYIVVSFVTVHFARQGPQMFKPSGQ